MQYLDEQAVVAPLLGYAPFARFYRQRRSKIRAPLVWMLDPTALADGANSPMSDGSTWIVLKRPMTSLDDAHTVAHELTHSLLDQEGYPSLMLRAALAGPVDVPPPLRNLLAILNGILDLEIDRRLRSVGFTGDRLMTLAAFERSLRMVMPTDQAAWVVRQASETGWDAPHKVRAFFLRVQGYIQHADTVIFTGAR